MRHVFIIQCHLYEPAVRLGNLLKEILPECKVIYSWDRLSKDYKLFAKNLNNEIKYNVGYLTVDQGLVHLNRFNKLIKDKLIDRGDFIHIISEADFPTKNIFNLDKILSGYVGYFQIGSYNNLPKSSTWYGLSYDIIEYLYLRYSDLISHALDNYVRWLEVGCYSGGYDEYILGNLFSNLLSELPGYRIRLSNLRSEFWPKTKDTLCSGQNVSDFGTYTRKSSPLTVNYNGSVVWDMENTINLFVRKLPTDSDVEFNKFKKYLLSN